MEINRNDIIVRTVLWNSNGKRCIYCTELILFYDLEIDHIIPQTTSEQELDVIKKKLNLSSDFNINSFYNLVPTHHNCNNRKSSKIFSDNSLRYYLELWKDKVDKIELSYNKMLQHSQNEKLLTQIGIAINNGQLNLNEIVSFVNDSCKSPEKELEPIIISCSINISQYMEEQNMDANYIDICDDLENELLDNFRSDTTLIYKQTESERNGETLSVRFAVWNIDLHKLNKLIPNPWEILEVTSYSEIYDDSWKGIFDESIVDKYNSVIYDENDPIFGLSKCPNCGYKELDKSSATDYEGDEEYYFIKCPKCDWENFTQ